MEFTTNDSAYTCDINALHNKIDLLHEQIEKNDTALATTFNEFPTVDEVNEALEKVKSDCDSKYALKSSIPDMTDYVLKSENEELKTKLENLESKNTSLKNIFAEFEDRLFALENYSTVPEYQNKIDFTFQAASSLTGFQISFMPTQGWDSGKGNFREIRLKNPGKIPGYKISWGNPGKKTRYFIPGKSREKKLRTFPGISCFFPVIFYIFFNSDKRNYTIILF